MPSPARPRVRPFRPAFAALLAAGLPAVGGGCAALPALGGGPPFARSAAADDGPGDEPNPIQLAGAESPADDSPFYDDPAAADRPGLGGGSEEGRFARARRWLGGLSGREGEASVSAAEVPAEARRAFAAARNDLDRGANREAAKAFKSLSRRYADTAIEEDALFYRAEALYAAKTFAPAQDAYDTLLDRYPSTRHLDAISKRQFDIARRWLGEPAPVVGSDVKPVAYAEIARGAATPPPASRLAAAKDDRPFDPTLAIPVLPNLFDRTRPAFDTTSRALEGLKNVWINDPTGELADDALFMSAGHALRKGDYMEAGRLYDTLRTEYPDSPHVQDAYLLGAYSREVVWQGPAYDDQGLKESRAIKESFLRLFPNHPDRDRVRDSLANMAEAAAESELAMMRLYQRKGKPKAVAMEAKWILENHPGTAAADEARRAWDALPAEARKVAGPLPSKPPVDRFETIPRAEPSVRPRPAPLAGSTADPFGGEPGGGGAFGDSGGGGF